MKYVKTYDLPLRIFHWLFALSFILAFFIAEFIDDDSTLYAYHMLAGIMMALLLVFRIFWGILGSYTARFTSFHLSPIELYTYCRSILSRNSKKYLGHNPASSYAAVLMFLFTITLFLTGLMMSMNINKHFFEEIHEIAAKGFLVIVIAHIFGVIIHQIKNNDGIIFSMINGKKQALGEEKEIPSNHSIIAIIFMILVFASALTLYKNYDSKSGKLQIFSISLKLGEEPEQDHDD